MALLFTVLCGIAIIILAYFTFYFTRGHFIEYTENVIDTEIKLISLLNDIPDMPEDNNMVVFIPFNEDGSKPDSIPDSISTLSEGTVVFKSEINDKTYAAKIHTYENGKKILVGVDITMIDMDFKLMAWLGTISIILIIIVIVISYLLSFFVVKGTNQIAQSAQEIMDTGDLSRRLEVTSRWDDLGNMTMVLNRMLDRCQELMEGIKQVSNNIAHDLRTPLTRMRNTIESLEHNSPSEETQTLLSEADHLLNTFNALLRISRIETGKQTSNMTELCLGELLADVVSFYEPLAEEKSIQLNVKTQECDLTGDKNLLFQAFANLLDNAIKYTPENGAIKISQEKTAHNQHQVIIEDNGVGIPESEIDLVFERFYRCEKSRSSSGDGLGLSLVKAVIDLHKGKIQLRNTNQGLQIITVL